MDGAFIAYHNTKEIFGFEYIKSKEIERRIFGNELYSNACFIICSKLLTTILNLLLEELKGEKFEMIKVGLYSDSHLKKMIIFAELFEENVPWDESKLINQTAEIKDEYDYYTKGNQMKNKVLKFEFNIYPYINGVYQRSNNFTLSQYDQIEVYYKMAFVGKANFLDYMNFLHEAYKLETLNLDMSYVGAWIRSNSG